MNNIDYSKLAKEITNNPEFRKELIDELNKGNAAKNWIKLMSFLLAVATMATSSLIVERIKAWIQ